MTASAPVSAVDRAAAWLRGYLAQQGGAASAGDVLGAGAAAGHSERGLRRACRVLGVTVTRHGFRGGSTWTMPGGDHSGQRVHEAAAAEVASVRPDGEAGRTGRVPSGVDARGRTEWAEVSSPTAASMWDRRAWRSVDEL